MAAQIIEEAIAENDDEEEPQEANPEEEPQEEVKNPHAQALGRLGGLKGGKARAAKLSAKRRSEIARKAAKARWAKAKKSE